MGKRKILETLEIWETANILEHHMGNWENIAQMGNLENLGKYGISENMGNFENMKTRKN